MKRRSLLALALCLGALWAIPAGAQVAVQSVNGVSPNANGQLSSWPAYVSGNWYFPAYTGQVSAGAALAANSIHCTSFMQPAPITITALGVRITTLAAAGNLQLAVYANNAATGRPTSTALASTASITTASTGPVNASASGTIPTGENWMCVNADNATVVLQTSPLAISGQGWITGSATQANTSGASTTAALIITTAQTFGTWPDLTSATWAEANTISYGLLMFKSA